MAPSFRLNRLLRLRKQLRTLREYEAGALEQQFRTFEQDADAAWEAREGVAEGERLAAETDALTPATLRLGRDYAAALADTERACRAAMTDTARALAAKREELTASHREESKVHRLEELHRERVDEERSRVMAQGLDELAIDRHERARRRR